MLAEQTWLKIILQQSQNHQDMTTVNLKEIMPFFNPLYSPEYLQKSNRLLLAIKNKVFTAQTNDIAEDILSDDPSDYNAWYLKKMYLLTHINQENILQKQVEFANEIIEIKSKGFQIWEQRRFLTQKGANIEKQYEKVEKVLGDKDQKNYHTWSFRVWLANNTREYIREMKYTQKMIERDAFNNSAWSHRFFALQNLVKELGLQERKTILSEQIRFAFQSLKQYRYNKASWNYLRGLFPSIKLKNFSSKNSLKEALLKQFNEYPEIQQSCVSWWKQAKQNVNKKSKDICLMIQRQVLATLVHIYSQKEQTKQYARNSCLQLILIDVQRKNYWGWVRQNL